MLHGEIDVGKNVKPGFVFPRFTIRVGHLSFLSKSPSSPVHVADTDASYHAFKYHISLLPFTASGFAPAAPADQPLLSEKVAIVTENAPGVIPHSHAPPGYVKPEEGNYNNSMGYLENGNQRFYHHHAGF